MQVVQHLRKGFGVRWGPKIKLLVKAFAAAKGTADGMPFVPFQGGALALAEVNAG